MTNQSIPEEIMVMIFKKLDYQSLTITFQVCKKWRELIHASDLFNLGNFGKFYFNR